MAAARKREVGSPHEAHHVPHGQPQVERHREADDVRGQPHAQKVELVLGEVGLVALQPAAQPDRRLGRAAEDGRLEDVERGQVDRAEDGEVERGLRRERAQPRAVAELLRQRLAYVKNKADMAGQRGPSG